jgi:hypothetical protein
MGQTIWWSHAAHTAAEMSCEGTKIGEDTVDDGEMALVLESDIAYVITGTKDELLILLTTLRTAVERYDNEAARAQLALERLTEKADVNVERDDQDGIQLDKDAVALADFIQARAK